MTGRHAYGPRGDSARMLYGVLVDARPRVTLAQQRAMTLGRELDTLNIVRARRQALAGLLVGRHWPPAGYAAWLMGTAHLDARRRQLRLLLADALLGYPEASQ